MKLVIPTILASSRDEFNLRFDNLIKISKNIQIDFMDGQFVPAKSISLADIPDLKKFKNSFEAHLMVSDPEFWIVPLKEKGFKEIIFHIEASKSRTDELIKKIKNLKLQPFIAINPETLLGEIIPYIHRVSGILFMGVHPGKEHQSFIPAIIRKIESLKDFNKKIIIQVDGGVSPKTARLLKNKADILNTGSFVSDSKKPKEALKELERTFL